MVNSNLLLSPHRGGECGRQRRPSALMDARRASAHPAGEVRPGKGAGFHAGPRRGSPTCWARDCVRPVCVCGGDMLTELRGEPAHLRTGSARCALRGDPKEPTRGALSRVSANGDRGTRANTKGGCGGLYGPLPSGARKELLTES